MDEIKPIALVAGWQYYYDPETDGCMFEHEESATLIEIEARAGAGVIEAMKEMLVLRRIFRHAKRKGVSNKAVLLRLEMMAVAENVDFELRAVMGTKG